MGYDKLVSFFSKNLGNNCINQVFIKNDSKGLYLANHIFFDIQFIIYLCINTIENDINYIIKLLSGLQYNDNKLIIKKIKMILNKPYWTKINLNLNFDGENENLIIENFIKNINESYIDVLLYWCIFDFLNNKIKNIHDINFLNSINIFFDGIPSYPKILEQRRRRIKTYIESQNRKKQFSKYFNEIIDNVIKDDDFYYEYFLFIKYQYSYSKSLGPYSKIMINLGKFLNKKLKECYPKKKIYVDLSTNYGEADFKIFNYINKNKIKSEIYIHSCDSDFLHLILNFQLQSKENEKLFYFVRYNLKNKNFYEIINASKILLNIKDKYKVINNLLNEPNINIVYDFLFIIFFFGNDIIPFNFEIGSELNLKILFLSHYELYKDNNFIININKKYMIDFYNLKIFLKGIQERKSFTIIILNKNFKIPYNFIILCTEVLNFGIKEIINNILVPYLSYEGYKNKITDKNDIRYELYKKYQIKENPLEKLSVKNELEEYMKNMFDYNNISDFGLIRLQKSSTFENNSYQTLYNKLITESSEKLNINIDKISFMNNFSLYDIEKNYNNSTNNFNVKNYLKLIVYLSQILFNNLNDYNYFYLGYYSENYAPSINKIIQFVDQNNMNIFQEDIIVEIKTNKYIFDELSHHLLITPYLLDSKYIKEIKNIKNLNSILNLIQKKINGIWYNEKDYNNFKIRDIDPVNYLETYYSILKLFNSKIIDKIYFDTSLLITY